jgi:DNA polymerase-3 subunit beta
MKLEIERDALLGALRQVADVVASRNTIPVLGNLLLSAEAGELEITGTDLDLQATARVPAAGEMTITVDKNKLLAAVQSMKPGALVLAMGENGRLTMRQGRGQRTLPTLPAADFPKRKPLEDAISFTMGAGSLARLFNATAHAMSSEETRYYLCGVFLHLVGSELRAAAADGHRLIRAHMQAPEGIEGMPDVIVPDKTVNHMRKLLDKAGGEVAIAITRGGTAISFAFDGVAILSKLVEGSYPDYQRTIPEEGRHRLEIVRDGLIGPLNAVSAVLSAEGEKLKTKGVAFDLKEGEEGAEVSGKDGSGTMSSEPLDGTYSGSGIRFGLNSRYGAILAGIFAEDARITLSIEDPRSAIRMVSDKDPDLIAVVMPMNA